MTELFTKVVNTFNFLKGQQYYVDQQLVKLQLYHKLLKDHTIRSKSTYVDNLLTQYENVIEYNTMCNVRSGNTFKVFKYNTDGDGNKVYMTLADNSEDTKDIQENQMFKGIWAPLNKDLYPEEFDSNGYSSLQPITSKYNSWAQLEYIKLQLEALMLEENIHEYQPNGNPS